MKQPPLSFAYVLGILAEGWLTGACKKDPQRFGVLVEKMVTAGIMLLQTRHVSDANQARALDLLERLVVVAERATHAAIVVKMGQIDSEKLERLEHLVRANRS